MKKTRFMKKLTAIMTSLILVIGLMPITSTVYADTTSDVWGLLAELNIMVGDADGDTRPYDTVTRAEMTKVAVAASDYRNSVATNLSVSPFGDVPYTHWSAPYVRVGVTNGLVTGYSDGTFRPDDSVTYEEAVTIMLRVLGYSDSDFGVSWPSGQIGMASNLDMTDNLTSTEVGSALTRQDVAQLVYNTLRTDKKDTSTELINIFDVAVTEDVTLISTANEDSSIPGDEVYTDNGSYKITDSFNYDYVGMKGDLVVKNNKTVIAFIPNSDESPSEEYIVYSVLGDSIVVYQNGAMTNLNISSGTVTYSGTTKTTFGSISSSLEMGDLLSVKRTNGNIDYIVYQEGDMQGPYTVTSGGTWASNLGISSSTTIMRGGTACSMSDIQTYDIIYYVPQLDMAFAYTNKVTGVYESASPNTDNPTSVVISGTTYEVEGSNAFYELSSSGSLSLGDTVTLLLGRNNDVADVVTSSVTNAEVVGYLCDVGTTTYTSDSLQDYSNYYITVVLTDGQEYTYTTSNNYENFLNLVVTVKIRDGLATVTKYSNSNLGISGTFNWDSRKIASTKLADDLEILDVGSTDSSAPSIYAKVYPSRIDGINLTTSKILYAHKDSSGDVDQLILNDVTGDSYTFGVVTSASSSSSGMNTSGSYSYVVNGTSYSLSGSSIYSVSSGQGVKMSSAQNPSVFSPLSQVSGSVSLTSTTSLTAAGVDYTISTEVQVYEKDYAGSSTYRLVPISDVVDSDSHTFYAYYDKTPSNGGRIRIIVAVKK